MTIFQAFILGLVQGITEFLPVSSTAHLVLFPSVLGWDLQSLEFDVALHIGTALAIILFFRKDWYQMFNSLKLDIYDSNFPTFHINKLRRESRLLITLFIVTIPVGIAALFLEDTIAEVFRSPIHIAYILIIISFVMWFAEIYSKRVKSHSDYTGMTFAKALMISLSQIIALFPGTSRSGITIATGLFAGLNRSEAARFSFLLATPIMIGAGLVKLPDITSFQNEGLLPIVVGAITAFVSAYIVIKWLLNFLRSQSLMLFIVYRILLGLFILVAFYNS